MGYVWPPEYNWPKNFPADIKQQWLTAMAVQKFRIELAGMRFVMTFDDQPGEEATDPFPVVIARDNGNMDSYNFTAIITLRRFQEPARFTMEAVHALGHAVIEGFYTSRDLYAQAIDPTHNIDAPGSLTYAWSRLFVRNGVEGTVPYWHGTSYFAWESRISNAAAELFKDVYLSPRLNSNRTDWELPFANYRAFLAYMDRIVCPPVPQ